MGAFLRTRLALSVAVLVLDRPASCQQAGAAFERVLQRPEPNAKVWPASYKWGLAVADIVRTTAEAVARLVASGTLWTSQTRNSAVTSGS